MNKILIRYQRLSVQTKSSFWYVITQIFQKGIGIIVIPLYTRILSSDDYGRYTIFYSWYDVMLVFGTLRIYYNSFNVGLNKFEKDRNKYTSSMLGFGGICTFSFFVVACIFHCQFERWLGMSFPFILLLFLEMFWDPAINLWMQREKFEFRYKTLNLMAMISTVATPLIGFLLINLLPDQALGAILGKSLPQVFAGGLCAYWILKKSKVLYDKTYWIYAMQFNIPLIFYYLAQVFLNQMDRIMIQKMGTVSQVAIYSVANAAANSLNIIASAINVSFIPYMFQKMKKYEREEIRSLADVLVVIVALCNMCLIIIAPEAIKILAPVEYRDSMWLVPPLVSSIFIAFVYQMYCNIEFYYEKKYFLMWSSIGVCLCNFILNYLFIDIFGYIAAGYTTLVSRIFCLIAHYICVNKILHDTKETDVFNNRFIIFLCIGFLMFSGLLICLYQYLFARYIIISLIVIFVICKRKTLGRINLVIKQ